MQFSTILFSFVSLSATFLASPVLERRSDVCAWPNNFQAVSYQSFEGDDIGDDVSILSETFLKRCSGTLVAPNLKKRGLLCTNINSPAAGIHNFVTAAGQTMFVSIGFWFKHLVQENARQRLFSTQTITEGGLNINVKKAASSTFIALASCVGQITMIEGVTSRLWDAGNQVWFDSVEFTSQEWIAQILYKSLFPDSLMNIDLWQPLKVAARKMADGSLVIYHYGG